MKQTEGIFQSKNKLNERITILCIILGCVVALGLAAIILYQTVEAKNDLAALTAAGQADNPYATTEAYGRLNTASDQMLLVVFPLMLAAISLMDLLRRRKYKQHMDAYGMGEADFARFDRDMQGEIIKSAWHTVVTDSFLFGKTPGHTYLFPLREVVFVYRHVTGMASVIYVCFRDGHLQTIPAAEDKMPALLRFLTDRCSNLVELTEKERRDMWVQGRRAIRRQARMAAAQYQAK